MQHTAQKILQRNLIVIVISETKHMTKVEIKGLLITVMSIVVIGVFEKDFFFDEAILEILCKAP